MSSSDRRRLRKIVEAGRVPANILKRSQALLLLADGWAPMEVPAVVGCGEATVRRVRQRYQSGGLDAVLTDGVAPGRERVFSKKDEERIVAMVCSKPPKGRARWTIRLVAEEAVRRGLVPEIGKETVRLILREHELKPWREKNVVHPTT